MTSTEDLKDMYDILNKDHYILDKKFTGEDRVKVSDIYAIDAIQDEYDEIYEDYITYVLDGDGDIKDIRQRLHNLNTELNNF